MVSATSIPRWAFPPLPRPLLKILYDRAASNEMASKISNLNNDLYIILNCLLVNLRDISGLAMDIPDIIYSISLHDFSLQNKIADAEVKID
jgi:hypothetical protein